MKSVLTRDGLIQLWTAIVSTFVKKETGRGLSMNDFTNTYKNKLDGIADNADVNIIERIVINENEVKPVDKTIRFNIPTNNIELENGAGYLNEAEVQAIVSSFTDELKLKLENTELFTNELSLKLNDMTELTDEEIDAICI